MTHTEKVMLLSGQRGPARNVLNKITETELSVSGVISRLPDA